MSEPVRQTLVLFGCVLFMALLSPFMIRSAEWKAQNTQEDLRDLEAWWKALRRGEKLPEPEGPLIPKVRIIGLGFFVLSFIAIILFGDYLEDRKIDWGPVIAVGIMTVYSGIQGYRAWTGKLRDDPEPEEETEEQQSEG